MASVPALEHVVPDECLDCGGNDLVEDWQEGNVTCRDCGVVAMERLYDVSAEYRLFAEDGVDLERVDAPGKPHLDKYQFTSVGGEKSHEKAVLNRAAKRGAAKGDKQISNVIHSIYDLSMVFTTSPVVADRAQLNFISYRESIPKNIPPSQLHAFEVASVFIACRNEGFPRSYRDMANKTDMSVREIAEKVKTMETTVPALKKGTSTSAKEIVPRYANRLGMSAKDILSVQKTAEQLQSGSCSGKSHNTIVAIAICIVKEKDKKFSIEAVADVCNLKEKTLKLSLATVRKEEAVLSMLIEEEYRKRPVHRKKKRRVETEGKPVKTIEK